MKISIGRISLSGTLPYAKLGLFLFNHPPFPRYLPCQSSGTFPTDVEAGLHLQHRVHQSCFRGLRTGHLTGFQSQEVPNHMQLLSLIPCPEEEEISLRLRPTPPLLLQNEHDQQRPP